MLSGRLRTVLAVVISAPLMSAGLVTGAASPASACDPWDHCWGVARGYMDGVVGAGADISPSCMRAPDQTFVTDEIWVGDGGSNWVEAGFLNQGTNMNIGGNTTAGIFGFYADKRPGQELYVHILEVGPSLSYKHVAINKTASNTYYVYFDGHQGLSTSNSMAPDAATYGSETNDNSTHAYSFVRNAQYYANGAWHSGMPGTPNLKIDAPNQFTWSSKSVSYNAGPAC